MSNTKQFLTGLNPTNLASLFQLISTARNTTGVVIVWKMAGGHKNIVQTNAGDGNGEYTTNFTDLSGPLIISGSGDVTTNYVDGGGATNVPSCYYRIRLAP